MELDKESRSTMKLDRELKIEIVAIVREELSRQKAENGSDYRNDKELLERMIRVEEALVHQGKMMGQRFEVVDKRFEDMHKYMDKRFEAAEKRFEDMHKYMDKRFEVVDKRFEDMHKYMDKRFEAVDKRFEAVDKRFQEMNANFKWVMGLIVASAIAIIGILKFI